MLVVALQEQMAASIRQGATETPVLTHIYVVIATTSACNSVFRSG